MEPQPTMNAVIGNRQDHSDQSQTQNLFGHQRGKVAWSLITGIIYVALCVLYVIFALSPSSYGQAFERLGMPSGQGLYLGSPQAIRSDEWMVLTPYFQIAVANGFGGVNQLSPYHELLRSFQALPILDWGLLFKPYHWGFFLLSPARAYSLYFLILANAFIFGWAWFMKLLRMPWLPALLVACTLYYAPFIQGWWTTNAGAFAFAPWVAIAWMTPEHRWQRIIASAYAFTVWLMACAYPPFLYSAALVMVVMVLACRRDLLRLPRMADAAVACAIALPLFVLYFRDLIEIIHHTVYPGQRKVFSGDVRWERVLAQILPTLTTKGYEPLPGIPNSNASEITVISSLLPLYVLALVDFRAALMRQLRTNLFGVLTVAASLALLLTWALGNVPPVLETMTGLFLAGPSRTMLAQGTLVTLVFAFAYVSGTLKLTIPRLIILTAATIMGTLFKLAIPHGSLGELYGRFDLVPYLCLGMLAFCHARIHAEAVLRQSVLAIVLLGNVLVYGFFNPVQSATPIFSIDREVVRRYMMEHAGAQLTSDGMMVAPGHHGALLAGVGLPTVNHVLYYPQFEFFRHYFPNLSPDEFNNAFNRYEHVAVGSGVRVVAHPGDTEPASKQPMKPVLRSPDMVEVPAEAFLGNTLAAPLLSIAPERPAPVAISAAAGHIDSIEPWNGKTIVLRGWLHAPLDENHEVRVWSSVPVQDVSLTPIPRPDVAQVIAPELLHSGANIEFNLAEPATGAVVCLSVRDRAGTVSTVEFPNNDRECTQIGSPGGTVNQ